MVPGPVQRAVEGHKFSFLTRKSFLLRNEEAILPSTLSSKPLHIFDSWVFSTGMCTDILFLCLS